MFQYEIITVNFTSVNIKIARIIPSTRNKNKSMILYLCFIKSFLKETVKKATCPLAPFLSFKCFEFGIPEMYHIEFKQTVF